MYYNKVTKVFFVSIQTERQKSIFAQLRLCMNWSQSWENNILILFLHFLNTSGYNA